MVGQEGLGGKFRASVAYAYEDPRASEEERYGVCAWPFKSLPWKNAIVDFFNVGCAPGQVAKQVASSTLGRATWTMPETRVALKMIRKKTPITE